jgi:hypothetical protein
LLKSDFPPEWWRIRFDVASPGFLFAWACVFERPVPSVTGLSVDLVKALGQEDFFRDCDKLVLVLSHTSPTSDREANR